MSNSKTTVSENEQTKTLPVAEQLLLLKLGLLWEPEEPAAPPPQGNKLPSDETPPEECAFKIGRYRLIRELGEGGFGIVWLAEQMEPFRREVALKLIKPGMDSRRIIARFEAERRTLALMDHPNIAAVLDAGSTSHDRPFFVMELVKGLPITTYSDRHSLSIHERLGIFLDVCRGVQHAHQKAILHRDLKPSNILVARIDTASVPKIIDFGIAKALGTNSQLDLDSRISATGEGTVVGTPQYMSPEQAGSEIDVDACSDIYSLGAILYELLTGHHLIDVNAIRQQPVDIILQIVRRSEPTRPSALILSKLSAPAMPAIAAARGTGIRKLAQQLRGDLDWIVLKAVDKDRHRRYETVAGFAADIEKYLQHEPISARPPSMPYLLGKLVRRNRAGFLVGMLVAAALFAGVGIAGWSYLRQRQALRYALISEGIARDESEKSQELSFFLGNIFQEISLRNSKTVTPDALRDLLDSANERRQVELSRHPETDGRVSLILARAYRELDRLDVAEGLYQNALDRLDKANKQDSGEAAECLFWIAWMHNRHAEESGKDFTAVDEQSVRRCLAIRNSLFPQQNEKLLRTQALLAAVLRGRGQLTEAEAVIEGLADGSQSAVVKASAGYGWLLREKALLSERHADFRGALDTLHQARKVLNSSTMTLNERHQAEADFCRIKRMLCLSIGDLDSAEDAANEELDIRDRWLGYEDPAVLGEIAAINQRAQDFRKAEAHLKKAVEISQRFGWRPSEERALRKLLDTQHSIYPENAPELLTTAVQLARSILIDADEEAVRMGRKNASKLDNAAEVLQEFRSPSEPIQPIPAYFFAMCASLEGRRGEYAAAIEDLSRAGLADPQNCFYRYQIAVLQLADHNDSAYSAERGRLIGELKPETNVRDFFWICRAALLRPITDPAQLQKIQEHLRRVEARAEEMDEDWIALLHGLAEFRGHDYKNAANWLAIAQRARKIEISSQAQFISAMNLHSQHEPKALVSLLESENFFDQNLARFEATDSTFALSDYLIVRLLRDEARSFMASPLHAGN